MCEVISIGWSELPIVAYAKRSMRRRVHRREKQREVWFAADEDPPFVPIRRGGRVQVARWGNVGGYSSALPRSNWTWQAAVEAGRWAQVGAEPVVIPATFARDKGVWYHVRQGIRGLLAPDETGIAVCFLICEKASVVYRNMTRSDRMPVFVNQRY